MTRAFTYLIVLHVDWKAWIPPRRNVSLRATNAFVLMRDAMSERFEDLRARFVLLHVVALLEAVVGIGAGKK